MKKHLKLKEIILVITLSFFSTNAFAVWWFIPVIFGSAKVVAVKTVVVAKISTVVIAKQSAAISGVAKASFIGKSIVISGKTLSIVSLGALAAEYGLGSSGSDKIDNMFIEEIASAKVAGLAEYQTKVCKNRHGKYYGIPTEAVSCLDGSTPSFLETPIDLTKLEEPKA